MFEISNFTNELLINCFNAYQKVPIKSTLNNLNFLKFRQKIVTENLFKISLVFNEIYREKEKIDILLARECNTGKTVFF